METTTIQIENMAEVKITKRRGRPVIEGSVRQQKLAKQTERVINGEVIRRGRPSNPNSSRQLKISQRMEILANGGVIKRGRPKMVKEERVKVYLVNNEDNNQ